MNVTKVLTKEYENKRLFRRAENKPNQTQFQTHLRLLHVLVEILRTQCKIMFL
jgi:hypothetical protein